MTSINFSKIVNFPGIEEINRIAAVFHISYHRAPRDMVIEVIEFAQRSFMGNCNYGIWGPEQAEPYKSMHPKDSIEDALNDALNGIRMFDSATIPNELLFWVSDNIVIDGNCKKITMNEARQRRCNNYQQYPSKPWTQALINGGPWWLVSKNFDSKQFSIIGPIDDDTEYVNKVSQIRGKGIDFRLETVPVSSKTKEDLQKYFENTFELEFVQNDALYK